ncbi:cytochrome P450 [Apiospora hydei]|uniref:Cytochrome P450 n=1 Tax=Apiospora hydei TaxID=1337664 RepID=A0ABR1V4U2_9PEZI
MELAPDLREYVRALSLQQWILTGILLIALDLVCIAVYRLCLSPLARFPGPKLAALTYWVETYYELFVGEGGQFPFEYQKWHKKYGPIIRINPTEIHIEDSYYYETFYAANKPVRKVEALSRRFGNPTAIFNTSPHDLHRKRRAPLAPLFSKRKISSRCHLIQRKVDEVCEIIKSEYKGAGKVLNCKNMFACLACDVMVDYCFGSKGDCIYHPDFAAPLIVATSSLVEPIHWFTQFPVLQTMASVLPDWLTDKLDPNIKHIRKLNSEVMEQCTKTIKAVDAGMTKDESDTIVVSLLRADLPKEEKTLLRLFDETVSLVGAGLEAPARGMNVALFHILNNPPALRTLQKELQEAIPDPDIMPPWEELQQLPWLNCCIEESLRLTYGTSQRMPRILDKEPTIYKEWVIPAGTIVSMDNWPVSHDETIFPDSFSFKPERWLGSPKAPDGKSLQRYQVAFARGTRGCLGTQLGYAELFITIATLFRRFDFAPHEFDIKDVEFHRDRLAVRPPLSSKGVRVLVN